MDIVSELQNPEFGKKMDEVQCKIGKETLSNDDLLILAAQSIMKTYTFEEKGYK